MSSPFASLQCLPTELLTAISQYLPPSTLLSLRYVCRRFNLLFTNTVKSLYSQCFAGTFSHWLTFLRMLESDNRLRQHLVCSKCKKTHHASCFSDEAQRRCPTTRECLGYEGKPWVCPHRPWTFAEIQELRKGNQLRVFHPSLWPVDPCRCLKDGMFLHTLFLHVETSKAIKVEERVKRALGLQRSTKCEHRRLRDPARKCLKHDDCESLGCDEMKFKCRLCVEHGTIRCERQKDVDM